MTIGLVCVLLVICALVVTILVLKSRARRLRTGDIIEFGPTVGGTTSGNAYNIYSYAHDHNPPLWEPLGYGREQLGSIRERREAQPK